MEAFCGLNTKLHFISCIFRFWLLPLKIKSQKTVVSRSWRLFVLELILQRHCGLWPKQTQMPSLASPAMGHSGSFPLDFQQFNSFSVHYKVAHSLTATLCGRLSKHVCILQHQLLLVQSPLIYATNNIKFYAPLTSDPGDATGCHNAH